jgi:hypothetical protein
LRAYQVDFFPAQLSPIRMKDGVQAELRPTPHIPVGDPEIPGHGVRAPLTARLAASLSTNGRLIGGVKAYRDPKTGRIVLGADEAEDRSGSGAIVLLSASSGFPDGVPSRTICATSGTSCAAPATSSIEHDIGTGDDPGLRR